MKIAFVYAGQGSQFPGMGKGFYERYSLFREIFDRPDAGFDLRKVCFEPESALLDRTEFTQPCMVAYQIGITHVLKDAGVIPSCVAGISLGEYSALHAAGVWDEGTVLKLAAYRGKIMDECVKGMECRTVSVIGLPNETVEQICREVTCGLVEVTNYCCEGNVTLGGERRAVEAAVALAQREGAKHIFYSKSAYPFHTVLLKNAGEQLAGYLAGVKQGKMEIPVVFNYTGRTLTEGESLVHLLKMQIQSSIRWEESIRCLEKQGVDTIIDIGPGRLASNLIRRISSGMSIIPVDTADALQAVKEGCIHVDPATI